MVEDSQVADPGPDAPTLTSADAGAAAAVREEEHLDTLPEAEAEGSQYATFDEWGGWKMHEPTSPWKDGSLHQHSTPTPANNIPRWQALTEEYQTITIPMAEATDLRKDLWLTSLNCGSLSEANSPTQINKGKLTALCWQFQRCGTDVMYLTDTRLTQAQGVKAIEHIRTLLPHGTFVRQSPVAIQGTLGSHKKRTHWQKGKSAPASAKGPELTTLPQGRIGGMLLIVSCKWSKHIKDWWKDPSGFGVVSSVTIQAMSQDITIFGTYWPFIRKGAQTSDAAGSLWSQLQTAYLTPNGLQDTPREYVENQLTHQMVRRLGKERNTCALIGDLNGRMTQSDRGAGPYILDTMCSKGWIPFLQTAP
jgi:hypothetical protein